MSDAIVLKQVSKRFGDVAAVDNVSLEVSAGSFVSLLGPSGCGKTTLLRLVGGFESPDAGRVLIGDADVTDRPPQRRPTAMVFQSYALFPNLSVGENVAYGLRVRKLPRAEIRRRVDAALARVDMAGYEPRHVGELSGGQQQRVALARALAVEPGVLLFDEPLSNLDLVLREETRRELKSLQRELGTTSLYVTHDQHEALALSDVVAVMHAGRIVEAGPPQRLYEEPETAFVAGFLGGSNLIARPALIERLVREPRRDGHQLAVRPTSVRIGMREDGRSVPARLRTRQFLGPFSEWVCAVEVGAETAEIRLWTNPDTTVPDELHLWIAGYRWVRT